MSRLRKPDAALPLLHLAAFWASWRWVAYRLAERTSEPWGLLALATAILIVHIETKRVRFQPVLIQTRRGRAALLLAALCTFCYVIFFRQIPPLLTAAIAVFAVSLSISACRLKGVFHPQLFVVLLLALPVIESFEFYFGYPLRLVVTRGAALWLRMAGISTTPSGALLAYNGIHVAVDAPCAGIKMLWSAAWVTVTIGFIYRLRLRQMLLSSAFAFLLVVFANTLRAAALFLLESGILPSFAMMHTSVGALCFAYVATLMVLLSRKLGGAHWQASGVTDIPAVCVRSSNGILSACFYLICLAAATIPLIVIPVGRQPVVPFEWPAEFEAKPISRHPMNRQELAFAEHFPGHMAKFTDGERVIIMRRVYKASRQFHPIEICFKAQGYTISPEPLWLDAAGRLWSRFGAARGQQRYIVRTLVYDEDGRTWPDIASWYWPAALGRSSAPWTNITVVER